MDDLAALLDPDLVLPIHGNEYRVQCSARQGLRVTRLVALGLDLDDTQERIEVRAMLADNFQQMQADGVSEPLIFLAGRSAILHYGHSAGLAAKYWETAELPGNPTPPPPRQKAVGEKLRTLFRRTASATTNAEASSPAHPERTGGKIRAAAPSTQRPESGTGTNPNRKQRRQRQGR